MRTYLALGTALALGVATVAVRADDPPDSELNPVTGYTETVDVAYASGQRVRHTVDRGQQGRSVALVSTSAGANPRIAISSSGDSWVVWSTDNATSGVFYRVRDLQTGTWSEEELLSHPAENSRDPEIVHAGNATWVVYQITTASSTAIAVTGIADDAEPFPTVNIVATTGYAGEVDALVHAEAGHVWVTWADAGQVVGWSEYDAATGTWGAPTFESSAGVGLGAARAGIRAAILIP